MKKFFSPILFLSAIAVFVFDMYFSIAGAIDVNRHLDQLAASGASGPELLGVGLDVLVILTVFVSVVGFVLSVISWKISQHRAVRIASGVLCALFLLPILQCALILSLR